MCVATVGTRGRSSFSGTAVLHSVGHPPLSQLSGCPVVTVTLRGGPATACWHGHTAVMRLSALSRTVLVDTDTR